MSFYYLWILFRLKRYLLKRCLEEKIQIKDRAEQDPVIVELCDRFRAHHLKECSQAIVTNLRYYCYIYNLNKFFLKKSTMLTQSLCISIYRIVNVLGALTHFGLMFPFLTFRNFLCLRFISRFSVKLKNCIVFFYAGCLLGYKWCFEFLTPKSSFFVRHRFFVTEFASLESSPNFASNIKWTWAYLGIFFFFS